MLFLNKSPGQTQSNRVAPKSSSSTAAIVNRPARKSYIVNPMFQSNPVQLSPTQSNSVQLSPTIHIGVATVCRHKIPPPSGSQLNKRPPRHPICHSVGRPSFGFVILPRCVLWPKICISSVFICGSNRKSPTPSPELSRAIHPLNPVYSNNSF